MSQAFKSYYTLGVYMVSFFWDFSLFDAKLAHAQKPNNIYQNIDLHYGLLNTNSKLN